MATFRSHRPLIVFAPPFSEESGGAIVLHVLVDRLRKKGIEAYICGYPHLPMIFPDEMIKYPKKVKTLLKDYLRAKIKGTPFFNLHPALETPIAPRKKIKDAIVIYPETINRNPLRSTRVIRWLLHKPGFIRPGVEFEVGEITYFYQKGFIDGLNWVNPNNQLQVRWIRDDIFFNRNLPRSGSCRLIRKGKKMGLDQVPDDDKSILLDGLSLEEMAEVFNKTEILWCHDPYTMYCYYAALCGCTPVVLPNKGMTSKQWRESIEFKFGVAYGEEEIAWARATRADLIQHMDRERNREDRMLENFIDDIFSKYS